MVIQHNSALIVGINDYDDYPLTYCVRDAREFNEVLSMSNYSFKTRVLTDKVATRRSLFESIDFFSNQKPSIFIFYFAGHGVQTTLGTYLVTHDSEPYAEGIRTDELAQILHSFADGNTKTLVILDCCHAGAASLPENKFVPLPRSAIETLGTRLPHGHVVLAACTDSQLASEDPAIEHGIFTGALIDAMLGDAADINGNITPSSIYDHVCNVFQERNYQTPVFRGDITGPFILGTDFVPLSRQKGSEEKFKRIEQEGKSLLEQYDLFCHESFATWQTSGYKEACGRLGEITNWLNRREIEFSTISVRTEFSRLKDAAVSRLKRLADVEIGTTVRHGVLKKKLGEGGFGTVWLVKGPDQRELAYKIYHPRDIHLAEKINRFQRGFRAMKLLDHPQVVGVYEYSECPVGFYMDFLDGANLRSLANTFSEQEDALVLLGEVASTILHAHERDVLHRDIKPENIVAIWEEAEERWVPYLTDFDLAWYPTWTAVTDQAIGTLNYASPEQIRNPKSSLVHKNTTDIYSFGQLLFFVVTGSDPAPISANENLRLLHKRTENWPSSDAAEIVCTLYERCTMESPSERAQNFREIVLMLDEATHKLITRGLWGDAEEEFGRYLSEVAFGIVGHKERTIGDMHARFSSLSGSTSIEMEVKEKNLGETEKNFQTVVRFTPLNRPGVQGAKGFSDVRYALNARVDSALRALGDRVKRRSGKQGTFEVFVDIDQCEFSDESVASCREIVRRVVHAIEAG